MANPRKFSEKIALHNQKQAEETAAFEAIMREVGALQSVTKHQQQHLNITQPNLGTYRGGSLPNVNQMSTNSIDLQSALHSLEDMKQATGRQNLAEKLGRERGRQIQGHRGRPLPFEKRIDCSPYGSAYLTPPPDTSWRRTNSDSALHTSAMAPNTTQQLPGATTPPAHRRVTEVMSADGSLQVEGGQGWDPKKLAQSRPKSCEVPGINIYPSPEQESNAPHVPISNNTGSLPDLTNLHTHFPSPLATPLDAEDAGGGGSNRPYVQGMQIDPAVMMAATTTTHESRLHPPPQYRPYHIHHSPHRHAHQQHHHHHHHQHQQQTSPHHHHHQQQHQQHPAGMHSPNHQHLQAGNSLPGNSLPLHNSQGGPVSPQYRNSTSDCPQSPTSPLSQPSYSPSQSPSLSPSNLSSSPFTDAFYMQQQQTNALQHQFEQFNMNSLPSETQGNRTDSYITLDDFMRKILGITQPLLDDSNLTIYRSQNNANLQDNPPVTSNGNGSVFNVTTQLPNLQFSQANMTGLTGSQDILQQQQHQQQPQQQQQQQQQNQNHYYSASSPQQPSSPQHQCNASPSHSNTQPLHSPTQQSSLTGISADQLAALVLQQQQQQQQQHQGGSNKIPDIIFTGVDEALARQDFHKDIANAMVGMPDGFDSDLFPSDEALKVGLDPLDLDGLQMLTDPNIVADPATEDSFRLDRL